MKPAFIGPGSRVTHRKFGRGIVLHADQRKATTVFEDGSCRAVLLPHLAMMEAP